MEHESIPMRICQSLVRDHQTLGPRLFQLIPTAKPIRSLRLVLALVAVCALASCLSKPPPFNESQWRQDVETQDTALHYAPIIETASISIPGCPWTVEAWCDSSNGASPQETSTWWFAQ
jgi:hypothetical protein